MENTNWIYISYETEASVSSSTGEPFSVIDEILEGRSVIYICVFRALDEPEIKIISREIEGSKLRSAGTIIAPNSQNIIVEKIFSEILGKEIAENRNDDVYNTAIKVFNEKFKPLIKEPDKLSEKDLRIFTLKEGNNMKGKKEPIKKETILESILEKESEKARILRWVALRTSIEEQKARFKERVRGSVKLDKGLFEAWWKVLKIELGKESLIESDFEEYLKSLSPNVLSHLGFTTDPLDRKVIISEALRSDKESKLVSRVKEIFNLLKPHLDIFDLDIPRGHGFFAYNHGKWWLVVVCKSSMLSQKGDLVINAYGIHQIQKFDWSEELNCAIAIAPDFSDEAVARAEETGVRLFRVESLSRFANFLQNVDDQEKEKIAAFLIYPFIEGEPLVNIEAFIEQLREHMEEG